MNIHHPHAIYFSFLWHIELLKIFLSHLILFSNPFFAPYLWSCLLFLWDSVLCSFKPYSQSYHICNIICHTFVKVQRNSDLCLLEDYHNCLVCGKVPDYVFSHPRVKCIIPKVVTYIEITQKELYIYVFHWPYYYFICPFSILTKIRILIISPFKQVFEYISITPLVSILYCWKGLF